jgi:predicted porin
VFGHYHHSDGLNRLASGDFPTAFLVGTRLENVESDGWYAGVTYRLTKNTSLNAVYGYATADEIPVAFTGNSLEKHRSIHANIIHKFWDRWQVGLEYKRFDVDAFNGRSGDVNFINGALWYFS